MDTEPEIKNINERENAITKTQPDLVAAPIGISTASEP